MDKQERNNRKAKYFQDFIELLKKESDRGCVIVSAAILDDILLQLLKKKLLPPFETKDELLENGSAALSSFSSKIDLAFRLGLIRADVRSTFHLIRKIRNEFAHIANPKSFDSPSIKSRVLEIFNLNESIMNAFTESMREGNIKEFERHSFIETLGYRKAYEFLIAPSAAFLLEAVNDIEQIKPSYEP